MSQSFEERDRLFQDYKRQNADASFSKFMIQSQANGIRSGGQHPTLGPRLSNGIDWTQAGHDTFRRYCSRYPIRELSKLIDYGCGSLRIGYQFINYLGAESYLGLDVTADYLEMGIPLLEKHIVAEKRPRFATINPESIAHAAAFEADFVICNNVAFQVHPDEKLDFLQNLQQLTRKPGALLIFDTKISEKPLRYRFDAWAHPLDFYRSALDQLNLVSTINSGRQSDGDLVWEAVELAFQQK